jgi:2,3-bisphosphoglycerate-dependent phosphoglycerate mutase
MQLYFIRHAQSENNVLMDQTGSSEGRSIDPELSDLGCLQVKALADFFGRIRPDKQINKSIDPLNIQSVHLTHLYTSLMVRAIATGNEISKTTGLPLLGWVDLHELGGIYQKKPETGVKEGLPGHSKSYLENRFPALTMPDSAVEQGWWNRPHESQLEGQLRAQRVYQKIVARHGGSDDRVGLISHADFYQLFLSVVLGVSAGNTLFFELNNAAITRIDLEENQINVVYLNRLDYMPHELITR